MKSNLVLIEGNWHIFGKCQNCGAERLRADEARYACGAYEEFWPAGSGTPRVISRCSKIGSEPAK